MDFACRALAVAATLALDAPLASLAEESDTPAVEPGSGAAENKPTRSDPPETELRELRVQAAPETDSFRATEANTGALGERPLLDTPLSINVVTHALIRNQQMDTPQDVFRNDPSFAWGNLPIPFGKPASVLFAVENVANRSDWVNAQNSFLALSLPLTVKLTARLAF
ncbi:MAG: hypothetical protein U1E63_04680 [Burkholderiales bacterium]